MSDWNSDEDMEGVDVSVSIQNSDTRLGDASAAKKNSSGDDSSLILAEKITEGNPPEMVPKDEVGCSGWYILGMSCEGSPLVDSCCSSELREEEGGDYYDFILSVEEVSLLLTIHRQLMKKGQTSGKLKGMWPMTRQSGTEQMRQRLERHRLRRRCYRLARRGHRKKTGTKAVAYFRRMGGEIDGQGSEQGNFEREAQPLLSSIPSTQERDARDAEERDHDSSTPTKQAALEE